MSKRRVAVSRRDFDCHPGGRTKHTVRRRYRLIQASEYQWRGPRWACRWFTEARIDSQQRTEHADVRER